MIEQYYTLEIIMYIHQNQIQPLIQYVKDIRHYAFITHDKDKNQDGELKKMHTHIIATFKQRKSFKACANEFNKVFIGLATVLPENITYIRTDIKSTFEYLTHKNETDDNQYKYDENLIVTDNKSYFVTQSVCEDDNKAYQLVCDLLDDTLSYRELLRKYGRDFVINADAYYRCANSIKKQEEEKTYEEAKLFLSGFNSDGTVI